MPYKTEKVKGGYYVVNTDTKKKYSKKPIPKTNADKQLKILNILYAKKNKK
jgi:hypothetical protein